MANVAVVYDEDNAEERAQRSIRPVSKKAPDKQPGPRAAYRERIKVIGVGGGGNNALNHIIRSGAEGVDFLAVNTDARCLEKCLSTEKLVIGERLTKGHGAGSDPAVGEAAAEESRDAIRECLKGADMVYLAAGMGGGTGTGAMPVVASIARELGLLTVAVVTRPFKFEGPVRARYAAAGIDKLRDKVDALIVVPNERLLQVTERTTSMIEAFSMADNILRQAVQGVTDLITKPGLINVDFADVRSVMRHAGGAVMGIGSGTGEHRASDALKRAMESPLIESSIVGAKGVILNITAHPNTPLVELSEASDKLREIVDADANFVWGVVLDESAGDEIKMVVIGTGFDMDKGFAGIPPRPGAPQPAPSLTPQGGAPSQDVDRTERFFSGQESPYDRPTIQRWRAGGRR